MKHVILLSLRYYNHKYTLLVPRNLYRKKNKKTIWQYSWVMLHSSGVQCTYIKCVPYKELLISHIIECGIPYVQSTALQSKHLPTKTTKKSSHCKANEVSFVLWRVQYQSYYNLRNVCGWIFPETTQRGHKCI